VLFLSLANNLQFSCQLTSGINIWPYHKRHPILYLPIRSSTNSTVILTVYCTLRQPVGGESQIVTVMYVNNLIYVWCDLQDCNTAAAGSRCCRSRTRLPSAWILWLQLVLSAGQRCRSDHCMLSMSVLAWLSVLSYSILRFHNTWSERLEPVKCAEQQLLTGPAGERIRYCEKLRGRGNVYISRSELLKSHIVGKLYVSLVSVDWVICFASFRSCEYYLWSDVSCADYTTL